MVKRQDDIDSKYITTNENIKALVERVDNLVKWVKEQAVPEINKHSNFIKLIQQEMDKEGYAPQTAGGPGQAIPPSGNAEFDQAMQDFAAHGGDTGSPFVNILWRIFENVTNNMFAPQASNAQVWNQQGKPMFEQEMFQKALDAAEIQNNLGRAVINYFEKKVVGKVTDGIIEKTIEGVLEE